MTQQRVGSCLELAPWSSHWIHACAPLRLARNHAGVYMARSSGHANRVGFLIQLGPRCKSFREEAEKLILESLLLPLSRTGRLLQMHEVLAGGGPPARARGAVKEGGCNAVWQTGPCTSLPPINAARPTRAQGVGTCRSQIGASVCCLLKASAPPRLVQMERPRPAQHWLL